LLSVNSIFNGTIPIARKTAEFNQSDIDLEYQVKVSSSE